MSTRKIKGYPYSPDLEEQFDLEEAKEEGRRKRRK